MWPFNGGPLNRGSTVFKSNECICNHLWPYDLPVIRNSTCMWYEFVM